MLCEQTKSCEDGVLTEYLRLLHAFANRDSCKHDHVTQKREWELNDKDRATIDGWAQQKQGSIVLGRVITGAPGDTTIKEFCDFLMETVPIIRVNAIKIEDKELPSIQVMDNVFFSALPREKLLPVFLESLDLAVGGTPVVEKDVSDILATIDIPVELKLYVATQCPHCPGVVRSMMHLAAACSQIHLHVIDGTWFDGAAARDEVLSAPCLILDNDFRWTGSVSMKEVAQVAAGRDPALLGTDSLRSILENGNAQWIYEKIKAHGAIFPGFVGLLNHEIWSVRLGAMVVVEELAQEVPALALQLVPLVLPLFEDADITVKGDLLYALGEVGDASVADIIATMMESFDDEDLMEAARDALSAIEERN